MRIRGYFAGAFLVLLALSGYLGLLQTRQLPVNDKIVHFATFFILTLIAHSWIALRRGCIYIQLCFYWVLDTSRRRTLHITLTTCTGVLAVGSVILQGVLPNGRKLDPFDIAANVLGSGAAVGLCAWYHKRMMERKRKARRYQAVPGNEEGADVDVELGESHSSDSQTLAATPSLDEQIDNWDENAADNWEDDEHTGGETAGSAASQFDQGKVAQGGPKKGSD